MKKQKRKKFTDEELEVLHNALQRKLTEMALIDICQKFSNFDEVEEEDKNILLITIAEQFRLPLNQLILLQLTKNYVAVQTSIGLIEWDNGRYSVYRNEN